MRRIALGSFVFCLLAGCGDKPKSAAEQVAELQLRRELEAEKNRETIERLAKAKVEADKIAKEKAVVDAAKAKTEADAERVKALAARDVEMERLATQRQERADAAKIKAEALRIENEKKRAESAVMTKWEDDKRRVMVPLYDERQEFLQNFPIPGQNGKKPSQIVNEIELALASTRDRSQKAMLEANLKYAKEVAGSLGPVKAGSLITEIEAKLAEVDSSSINPTLPNWGSQNGRTTFKSIATRNMIKAGLAKDLEALKKYKSGLEAYDKKIADTIEEFNKTKPKVNN